MVILESLASGTPVVSFDCESGPRELVKHEQNGLLVTDQDFDELLLAIERMASDAGLYAKCQAAARSSVEGFSLEKVGQKWLDLLKIT